MRVGGPELGSQNVGAPAVVEEVAPRPAAAAVGGAFGAIDRAAAARDLRVFNRIRKGELDAVEGLKAIAYSGGWPIRTANGFLFAHPAGDAEACFIAGEHNGWKPQPMKREGGLFWIQLPIAAEHPCRYKLVDAKGEWRADPWSRNFAHDANGEYSLTFPREGARFERWPAMTDGVVEPRAIRVFIPEDRVTHHLFVHDGQTLFDPKGPHGGWKLHEATGPTTMIIGIDNTGARRNEYTHVRDTVRGEEVGGGADHYVKFVEETVRPFVEARYGKPRKVGVMGASLGGLVSYYQHVKYPNAYDFVAGLSATMRWGKIGRDQPTIVDLFRDKPKTHTTFYLDSGGEPNGRDNYESNSATADKLAELGYAWNDKLYHWHEPHAEHTEKEWARRVHRPLAIFEKL